MNRASGAKNPESLTAAADDGSLCDYLNAYVTLCHQKAEESKEKGKKEVRGEFPNLAGFCRFLGCGLAEVEELRRTHPALYSLLCATLEDEALNSSLSPTLLSAYLKERLGYGEKKEERASADCGQLQLVFEHNILEDGA